MSALRWRQLLAVALVVTGAQALADASNWRAQANGEVQARRVWVLSDPDGYASGSRQREIVVYDLTCEEGKMTRVSEGFEVASGPKFGEGWVIRTHGALSAAAEQEQLKRAFADVCGNLKAPHPVPQSDVDREATGFHPQRTCSGVVRAHV